MTDFSRMTHRVTDLDAIFILQIPWATVFRVEHCGFTVAWRSLDEDSEWDWQLKKQQEGNGVDWTV